MDQMTDVAFVLLALVLAALPTWRWLQQSRGREEPLPAQLRVLFAGQLAGLFLAWILRVSWSRFAIVDLNDLVTWQPSLWLVGVALAVIWWRVWRHDGQTAFRMAGAVSAAFLGAQTALASGALGLIAIVNLPDSYFPEIDRTGLDWALFTFVPPMTAWLVVFQVLRLLRREPSRPWSAVFTLVGTALALALTMVLPGMVIESGFRGGGTALLGLPWNFLMCVLIAIIGVFLAQVLRPSKNT
jgi:hypothetical protein